MPTVVIITMVLAGVGLVIGGIAGAWWALRQPDPKNHRDPPRQANEV